MAGITKANAAALAGRCVHFEAIGKLNYARSDAALHALTKIMKPGQTVTLKGGKKFQLVDEFDGKLIVFRPCGVRRFSLKEIVEP